MVLNSGLVWRIEYSENGQKDRNKFFKFDSNNIKRIKKFEESVRANPTYHHGYRVIRPLRSNDYPPNSYRYSNKHFRVLYTVEENSRLVWVFEISNAKNASYDKK